MTMYAPFFGLAQEPFSIAPDPRYLYMSERHREALAHLIYGVAGGGGFVLLTGEIGAGKTTVCRCFLEQIPKRSNVAYIFNPKLTALELLQSICDEYRIPVPAGACTFKDYLDPLNDFLLRTHGIGQNNVLIIDEAQNLDADVLEQLRLLTNLETNERKLLQIILIGQPELRDMLARPELEQLAQRVIARFHLDALSAEESEAYVRHRLQVAGLAGPLPFDRAALKALNAAARGVPRRINLVADRALLGAYALGRARVDGRIVRRAAQEVFGGSSARPCESAWSLRTWGPRIGWVSAGGLVVAALGASVLWLHDERWWSGVALGEAVEMAPTTAALAASAGGSDRLPTPAAGASSGTAGATAASRPAGAGSPSALPEGASPTRTAAGTGEKTGAGPAADTASRGPGDGVALTATGLRERLAGLPRDAAPVWRQLGELWGSTLEGADPCVAAAREQLLCFRSDDGLALLRQLGRPAVLSLRDGADRIVPVVLEGLDGDRARLRLGGAAAESVPLIALAAVWRGEFGTLWRAPPGYAERRLDRWLAETLREVDRGQGGDLRQRLRTFQSSQGLKPDGVAGPITLMRLNRAAGVGEPRLGDG